MKDEGRTGRADLTLLRESPPWEWPEDAAETLIRILGDEDVSDADRLAAAECAGDFVVSSDEMSRALMALVRRADRSVEVRSRAAISLGPSLEHVDIEGFDDPDEEVMTEETFHQIQTTLRAMFADGSLPKDLRRSLLEASIRAPQDWHADAVRTAFASGDADWRLTAVFAMRFLRGFDREILEALRSEDARIRCQAVHAAGSSGVEAAWPHVAELLRSRRTPKDLLLAAIEAAPSIRQDEALDLLPGFTTSRDEEIAAAAEEALLCAQPEDEDEDEDEADEDADAAEEEPPEDDGEPAV